MTSKSEPRKPGRPRKVGGKSKDGFTFESSGLDSTLYNYLYVTTPQGQRREVMKRLMLLGLIQELNIKAEEVRTAHARRIASNESVTYLTHDAENNNERYSDNPSKSSTVDLNDGSLDDLKTPNALDRERVKHVQSTSSGNNRPQDVVKPPMVDDDMDKKHVELSSKNKNNLALLQAITAFKG